MVLSTTKARINYQLKSFIVAMGCVTLLLGIFTYMQYKNLKEYRRAVVANSVDLAIGSLLDGLDRGEDMNPFIKFINSYLDDSPLEDINFTAYDTTTGRVLYDFGTKIPEVPKGAENIPMELKSDGRRYAEMYNVTLSDGEKYYLYSRAESVDGSIAIHTYVPHSQFVENSLKVDNSFWITVALVFSLATVLVWIITAHQAKNITLLKEFADRASADKDFIPTGDFPSDEIGDISRQIISIYNSRMQANVRRERDHAVALKAIEEKNHIKRVMTNNISHELKTPIGIIRSYLEMILGTPDMSAEERDYFLSKCKNNVDRLVAMLNDLSTMTRLEESSDKIPITDIDFHDLVFSLAEDFNQGGVLGDMEFQYDIPLDCHIWGNGGLIISSLSNLAKNAAAYSQGKNVGIKLVGKNANFYTFSFYDDGVGVGDEHLPRLFERFYRIDTGRSRKVGGTGLGLPIVKSSINTMGGSITVRNRKGGGLEFIFTLKRVKPGDADAPTEAADLQGEQ